MIIKPRIAIVDDDPSMRKAMERLLQSHGFDFESFASAEQFLASGEQGMPECLILDIRLPGMDGLSLQERLTQARWNVPIVFVTARHDEQTRRKALAAHAVAFLQKPFDNQNLLDAVKQAIRRGDSSPEA